MCYFSCLQLLDFIVVFTTICCAIYIYQTIYIICSGWHILLYLQDFRTYYTYYTLEFITYIGLFTGLWAVYQALKRIISIGLYISLYLLDFKSHYICQILKCIISIGLYNSLYLSDFKSQILFGLWMQGHKALTERSIVKVATKWQGCVGYADLT